MSSSSAPAGAKSIWEAVQALAAEAGGEVPSVHGTRLLNEVADLVEAPTPLLGHFEDRFLSLPPEVLQTVMVKHQRFFPIVRDGVVVPAFVSSPTARWSRRS